MKSGGAAAIREGPDEAASWLQELLQLQCRQEGMDAPSCCRLSSFWSGQAPVAETNKRLAALSKSDIHFHFPSPSTPKNPATWRLFLAPFFLSMCRACANLKFPSSFTCANQNFQKSQQTGPVVAPAVTMMLVAFFVSLAPFHGGCPPHLAAKSASEVPYSSSWLASLSPSISHASVPYLPS